MELSFRDFVLNELFDSSVEIDWGKSSGRSWSGIFFVPVKGMNPEGAAQLRQRQKQSQRPWDAPPGHIKYSVNITIDFAPTRYLIQNFDPKEFNTFGTGKGHLLAQVNFKRHTTKGATFERPGEGERGGDENLVFGTVRKGIEDVLTQSGAKITGIHFVSHSDQDAESASKRLRLYKTIGKVLAPRYGFVQVPSKAMNDILLIKKEYVRGKDQAPFAIPIGSPQDYPHDWSGQRQSTLPTQPQPFNFRGSSPGG